MNQLENGNHPILSLCSEAASGLYGDNIPDRIARRMEEELQHILINGFSEPYLQAGRFVGKANIEGYLTRIRGSAGSSFVAYLLGVTEINPLPAHYICQKCRSVEWAADMIYNGFDLPYKPCPMCGDDRKGDGHNIPYEMFFGVNGDIPPNISIYVPREYEEIARNESRIEQEDYEANRELSLPKVLGCDSLSIMNRLHHLTGVNPRNIPMNDYRVMSLFRSVSELGVASDEINTKVAAYGIPEMSKDWVREMLEQTQPSSFGELVQISGLSHGTGTWEGNARERIQAGAGTLLTAISCRDQLMLELIDYGLGKEMAFAIADRVRRGDGVLDSDRETMMKCKVPEWYIESCGRIKYLFPKSHTVSNVMIAVRHAFYKLYYPMEFYAAYFSVRGSSKEMDICVKGEEAIRECLENRFDADRILVELALEMSARGFRIFKSANDSGRGYIIEGDNRSLTI